MPKITFIEYDGTVHDVEAEPGETVMEAAMRGSVAGIVAECGGSCTCATCHVWVDPEWYDKLRPATDDEEDLIFSTLDQKPTSRLSCQIILDEALDGLKVTLTPSAAKEPAGV
jgi:2Fe-2S ferredoxin